ncbi:helix-turn-helix domain-containing protein [Bacillus massilinigeriensis]|uniref:helix-turn-helix domain-containing protein n=1 Tax=Bacillus massilionigeriensis TaxID=1805475 RepID=UPI00096B0A28|nr:helix-turn-helix transcriptional regulator [Bacillus massilionigeriensis]
MEYEIGDILKSFREYKSMTIEELADGICTVEELASFEKEKAYPTIEQLHKLGIKLNIELSYFFEVASKSTINYSTAVTQIIEKYKRERNYHAIYHIVQKEKLNPIFNIGYLKQYLLWHEGISTFYIESDLKKAISFLYEAIKITNPSKHNLNERETEILNSIAILLFESRDYKSAFPIFLEALTNLDQLPHILNPKVKIRVLFGLSQVFTQLGQYNESLIYCQQGINLCINEESLYCLNEFYYQTGENLIKLGEIEKGKASFEKCLFLLKLENKTKIISLIEKEMDKLLSFS